MKQAKLFSILVSVLVLGYGAVGFYFLPLAGFQGDLTRTGLLPESLFGWRKPQVAIDPAFMRQASWQEADVLVIGDSFSLGHIWQSVLVQQGLKVRTESWDSMRGISEDFTPWLRQQGFKGKYVVLEIIERSVVNVVARSMEIKRMEFHPDLYADSFHHPPPALLDAKRGDYSGRFSIGIQTRINALKYEHASRSSDFSSMTLPNDTRLSRVRNGCELFSHARCNDVLFLGRDSAEDIPASTLENIEKLNKRLRGVTPIWAFVPNKSTAYLYPGKQFWHEAERRLGAPDLLRMTQQATAEKVIDLYPANNTHFSTAGYLMMGDTIFKAMQQNQYDATQVSR